ncbi:hypothetical protein M23134_08361 [Microscilla marina ATCC 23134]|uniref:Uncharacterized protein n=2 Tax=Microscilla marina TaxID=1027 RepID=A1ZQZ8_MICM2|nr:hypothetical protein M23134_08361 [Microscilla marina ATCC 23134]
MQDKAQAQTTTVRQNVIFDGSLDSKDSWRFHRSNNNYGLYVGRDPQGNAGNQWEFLFRSGGTFEAKFIQIGSVIGGNRSTSYTGKRPVGNTYRLSVDGHIITENVTTLPSGSWPDYVFEKDYQLQSLSEIESYIQKNKHLPNVPSAKQVLSQGFELNEMTKALLQNIEVLTLHTIAQQKQLKKQAQAIEILQKKLANQK